MVRRLLVFVLACVGVLLPVALSAQPASAQYHAEGPFTVNPSNIVQGGTTTVQGYCANGSPVTVKLDNTTVVGTGVVPGVPSDDSDYVVTSQVTITVTIPVATPTGPHKLWVYCHTTPLLISTLNIVVFAPACNTTGSQPPPLGGVYGIYGGDPQGASPAPRAPNPSASFQGNVTSQTSGLPIANASIELRRADGSAVGSETNTDVNGNYAFGTISKGQSYKVEFIELGFVTQTSGLFAYTGSPITVNAALAPAPNGPGVNGVVTDVVTGQVLQNVSVRLWLADSISRYLATATNASGQYSFVGIPAGSYQVQFATPGYATYWYLNATIRGSSTVINLGATQQTVNAQMTGLCKSNPSLISAIFGSKHLPITLSTGGVLLLVLGSSALLFDTKRRTLRAGGRGGRSSGSAGSALRRRLPAFTRRH